jgi:Protein of unknown function (DUF2845)
VKRYIARLRHSTSSVESGLLFATQLVQLENIYTLAYRRCITMKAKVRLLAILLLSVSPTTALGFKCGRSIINEGKSIEYVLDRCGQPSYSQEHTEYRVFRQTPPAPDIVEPIIIQEWRYNFGRNRLMRYLRFENGVLIETESIGIQR